jgi:hypothetical protein
MNNIYFLVVCHKKSYYIIALIVKHVLYRYCPAGGGGLVHIWVILYSGECGIMGFWKLCQRIKPFKSRGSELFRTIAVVFSVSNDG